MSTEYQRWWAVYGVTAADESRGTVLILKGLLSDVEEASLLAARIGGVMAQRLVEVRVVPGPLSVRLREPVGGRGRREEPEVGRVVERKSTWENHD